MRYGRPNFLVLIVTLTGCVTAMAQKPAYNVGRTPTPEEIRAWDIAIGPEGKELPPGRGTAKEGAPIYAQICAACHGRTGEEVDAASAFPGFLRPLIGGKGTLTNVSAVTSIGSYWPFATTLWDYINRAMPLYPVYPEGFLSANQVYAVTAFLLYRNGIIQENDVLDAQSLPKIRMPNRNGFLPLDPTNWNPEVRIEPHIRKR